MNRADRVAKFVEDVFDLYGIHKFGFFLDCDDETMEEIAPPLFPNKIIDEDTNARVSTAIGLTSAEILSRDMTEAKRYWEKILSLSYLENIAMCGIGMQDIKIAQPQRKFS